MSEETTYPAISEAGRYIGNYAASDICYVFHGKAHLSGGRIIVAEETASTMIESGSFRRIKNDDESYGLWDESSFLSRFGIVFALNIHSKADVRKLMHQGEDNRPELQHKKIKKHSTSEGSNLDAFYAAYNKEASELERRYSYEEGRYNQELAREQRGSAPQKEVGARQRTSSLSAKKPPYRQRHKIYSRDFSKDSQTQAARRNAYLARSELREAGRAQSAQHNRKSKNATAAHKSLDVDSIVLTTDYPDEETARYVQRLYRRKGLAGLINKMLNSFDKDLPSDLVGLTFSDLETRARNGEHFLISIIHIVSEICVRNKQEQPVDDSLCADLNKDQILIDWANANLRAGDSSLRAVCQAVLHGQEHVLIFDETSYSLASVCCKPLHHLPYRVTLVKTSGNSPNWGIAALSEPDGISVFPIGKSADIHIGCNLLAFVENECSAIQLEDGGCDYVGREADYAYGANDLGTKVCRQHYIDGASSATHKPGTSIRRGPLEPHTRRAHQRRQHFGPKGMYVKIIHINETTVFPKGMQRDLESLPEEKRVHHVRV